MATTRGRMDAAPPGADRQRAPAAPEAAPVVAPGVDVAALGRHPAPLSGPPRAGRGYEPVRAALLLGLQQTVGNQAVVAGRGRAAGGYGVLQRCPDGECAAPVAATDPLVQRAAVGRGGVVVQRAAVGDWKRACSNTDAAVMAWIKPKYEAYVFGDLSRLTYQTPMGRTFKPIPRGERQWKTLARDGMLDLDVHFVRTVGVEHLPSADPSQEDAAVPKQEEQHVKVTAEAVSEGASTRVTAVLTDWSGGMASTQTWGGYLDATGCAGGIAGFFGQKDCTCTVVEQPPPPDGPGGGDVEDDEGRSEYA